ncbi:hypothetical protein Bbelb_017260 [Branchiostoma belcheri]|nr:hypothetical protein Bbelb_017260 [Branchiostoma belcheri]
MGLLVADLGTAAELPGKQMCGVAGKTDVRGGWENRFPVTPCQLSLGHNPPYVLLRAVYVQKLAIAQRSYVVSTYNALTTCATNDARNRSRPDVACRPHSYTLRNRASSRTNLVSSLPRYAWAVFGPPSTAGPKRARRDRGKLRHLRMRPYLLPKKARQIGCAEQSTQNYRTTHTAEARMDYMREKATKARDALAATFTGGNQNNGDPDGMEVDPPSGQQGHFDSYNYGGQRHSGFSGSGGGYQPHHANHYPQDRRGTRGQQGPHVGSYSSGYQNQRHQGAYRTNPAFHEQGGGMYDSHGYNQHQEQLRAMQMREQRHRSLQASKQMVYDVYATTIGMLEEFEDFDDPAGPEGNPEQEERDLAGKSRETVGQGPDMMDQWEGADHPTHGQGRAKAKGPNGKVSKQEKEQQGKGKKKKRDLGRSDVKIPDQSHKTKRDVKAIVEAELVCLQAQLRFCPAEIRDQTRQELVDKTLGWVAAREAKGLKKGLADVYASQVVEILVSGETKLHVPTEWEKSTGPAGEEAVLGGVRALQVGQHYGAEQDKQFHDDPNKKARCPDIRSGPVPEVHGEISFLFHNEYFVVGSCGVAAECATRNQEVPGAKRLLDVNPNLHGHLEDGDMR